MGRGSTGATPPEKGDAMDQGEVKAMFSSAPTAEELQPTVEERRLLDDLREWQEKSAQSHWVLGQPTHR